MTKHLEKLPTLPAGSVDFNKLDAACKVGKEDPFKGAVSHERGEQTGDEPLVLDTPVKDEKTGADK